MASKQSQELTLVENTNNNSLRNGRTGRRSSSTNNNNNNNKKQRTISVGISTAASASASAGVVDDEKMPSKFRLEDIQKLREEYIASLTGPKNDKFKKATPEQILLLFTNPTTGLVCLKPDGNLPMTQKQMAVYLRENKLAWRCNDNRNCTHTINECMATNCLDYALGNECKYLYYI